MNTLGEISIERRVGSTEKDMNDVVEAVKRLQQKAEARNAKKSPQAPVLHLPVWPAATRGTPNALLRGALFAAIQGKDRRAFQGELLAAQKGITIRLTGWQLDQSDLDVWEQAVQLATSNPLGESFQFRIKTFLKAMGRAMGGANREWLRASFRRLGSALVEIKQGHHTYAGSLLEWEHNEETEEYWLRLNPRLLTLYTAGWTAINWDVRQRLRGKPLALWLYGWLSSHAENFPTKLETIRLLSGSTNRQAADFKRKVKAALCELVAVDAIQGYSFDGDLVTFERTPTFSQQRHRKRLPKPGDCG